MHVSIEMMKNLIDLLDTTGHYPDDKVRIISINNDCEIIAQLWGNIEFVWNEERKRWIKR